MPRWVVPWKAVKNLLLFQGLLVAVVIVAALGLRLWTRPASTPAIAGSEWQKVVDVGGGEIFGLWEMDVGVARSLLHQGIPLLKKRNNPQTFYGRRRGLLRAIIDLTSDVDVDHPMSILQRMIMPLSRFEPPRPKTLPPNIPKPRDSQQQQQPAIEQNWGDSPLIAIYHTHSSETYLPEAGTDRTKGEPGGVMDVGEALSKALWDNYRIPVVHNRTIHDYPKWRLSYVNSEETAAELVKTYPDLQMVIDLHRDAAEKAAPADYTTTIDGVETARVMIVVGTDKLGLPHPHWRDNYKFAQEIDGIMKELYPGLSRGVDLRNDGRWNQHLHRHSVILEFGEVHQSKASAIAAARCMARVIYEYLLRKRQTPH